LGELESFWASIPGKQHVEWSNKIKGLVVDGSPTWEVFRRVEFDTLQVQDSRSQGGLTMVEDSDEAAAILLGAEGAGAAPGRAREEEEEAAAVAWASPAIRSTESGLAFVEDAAQAERIIGAAWDGGSARDWKGDPMEINPGDKLPRIQ